MDGEQPVRVLAARRADAGMVRLGERDITGLVLCAEHYGAPYDLLAAALEVRPDGCGGSWPGGAAPDMQRPARLALVRPGAG
jgi:hypothetical protein